MSSHFEEKENIGRELFLNTFGRYCHKIQFTPQGYSYDVLITDPDGHRSSVEIKRRNISITKYPDCIYERIKYDCQMHLFRDYGITPYYIVFYDDAVIIWDISRIDLADRFETMNCTRDCNNYVYGQVPKEITRLKREEAIWTGTR